MLDERWLPGILRLRTAEICQNNKLGVITGPRQVGPAQLKLNLVVYKEIRNTSTSIVRLLLVSYLILVTNGDRLPPRVIGSHTYEWAFT
jgi:hypothetical protein